MRRPARKSTLVLSLGAGLLAAVACGSAKSGGSAGADGGSPDATNPADAGSGVAIGPDGGTLIAYGIEVDVPPGALTAPVALSVALSNQAPPAGYALVSSFYRFAPAGTTFAVPVAVHFQTDTMEVTTPGAVVYWSRADGGYEALPTTWLGINASAEVVHFSTGFVGVLGTNDAGVLDGGAPDANDAAADASQAGDGATDAGDATLGSDGSADASDGAASDAEGDATSADAPDETSDDGAVDASDGAGDSGDP